MKIYFLQIEFCLKFSFPTFMDSNPMFVLRSVLGKNLHTMCCISRKSKCAECQFSKTCVYAFLFETILSSDNGTLPGRNRASHPYSFSSTQNLAVGNFLKEYSFEMTLFGRAIEYLPYIYAAFVRSGQNGLFKSRTTFKIENVFANGKNILIDENHLDMNFFPLDWNYDFSDFGKDCNDKFILAADEGMPKQVQNDGTERTSEILVNLKSPLRFKVAGRYTLDFTAKDFINCLFRRVKTLCSLYGEISEEEKFLWQIPCENILITEKNLHWVDIRHYSARQKTSMDLGGTVGTFKLCGNFSEAERCLLKFAEVAGAGKNTNFGLGQLECWEK